MVLRSPGPVLVPWPWFLSCRPWPGWCHPEAVPLPSVPPSAPDSRSDITGMEEVAPCFINSSWVLGVKGFLTIACKYM